MAKKYETLEELIERYPALSSCEDSINKAFQLLVESFGSGHRLYIGGNGGSCADAEHIAGELMKGFVAKRKIDDELAKEIKKVSIEKGDELVEKLQKGFPVVVLSNHQSLNTAFSNDVKEGGVLTYAQQVNIYGNPGDVLLAISTSGNAENLVYAAVVAKAKGMKVVELTGSDGGKLKEFADVAIKVPETETYKIQELHLPVYHCLCMMLEEHFYK